MKSHLPARVAGITVKQLGKRTSNKRVTSKNSPHHSFGGILISGFDTETEPHTRVVNSPMRRDSRKELNHGNLNPDMEIFGVGSKGSRHRPEKPVQDMCTQIEFSDDDLAPE